ncbi:MATE family efflux transporter [Oceanobacillus iheyensis]|uniref:Probable multidrug resistance protein NorM n=1 Tax=Oceanobacillus iheyensis (strain DSM 14371 / CIP 107618 / JCM 11309 / KCTC 3954 / HTE831) TaxID=221109 RepID=NORM_OCEIH|nr:MATE family efflux transporter [Oceanobacillus iheyensis]Q8CUL5.2 RecName: Full=Probable multidrug resistance protein NorM; AltName: Full=Multidrug-efflux transporter [Oceanobacillus iheyensis HTE831]
MYQTTTLKDKIKLFIIILLPILITQVSINLMSFFDTMMSGQFSARDLAGVAIGSSLWVPILTGINGIVLSITPIIAHLIGAKNKKDIPQVIQQGIYLSFVLSIIIIVIGGIALDPILQAMSLEKEVQRIAKYYLITLGTGIVPLFLFHTIRSFMDGLGQTRSSMIIILISLPINAVLNYILIFGKFGIPAFGGIGAGIATSLTYWIISGISIFMIHRVYPFHSYKVFQKILPPTLSYWADQLKIGLPIGLAIFFETSIFSAVTLLMSEYNTNTIAAHQAAMNFASLLYMLPLSVGMALTIAVGFEVGAKRLHDAKRYTYLGIMGGLFIAIFAGIILYTFDDVVARLYNSNPEVIELTKQFIIFAIFYQLADAIGAPIQGALRGYKDVNMTLVIALISYWIIGLPTGYLLANYTALEPFGYWVGIIVGLSTGAIALLARLLFIQKKSV